MNFDNATLEDVPQLCNLLDLLFSQEAEFKTNYDSQYKGLVEIISNPNLGQIIVARDLNVIVGMVSLLYTVSTALGGKVAILEDMVVSNKMRRRGVGSQLIKHCLSMAKDSGVMRVTLLTDHDNHDAQSFYKKHGFTMSTMVVLRKEFN